MSPEYLAGFFDGEGCIDNQVMYAKPPYDNRFYVRPRLRLAQANNGAFILKEIQATFGGSIRHRPKGTGNQQDSASWELLSKDVVIEMLRMLEPLLIIKKQQARLALWWFDNCAGKTIPEAARRAFNEELKMMKRDPQRLSEEAAARIESLMR